MNLNIIMSLVTAIMLFSTTSYAIPCENPVYRPHDTRAEYEANLATFRGLVASPENVGTLARYIDLDRTFWEEVGNEQLSDDQVIDQIMELNNLRDTPVVSTWLGIKDISQDIRRVGMDCIVWRSY